MGVSVAPMTSAYDELELDYLRSRLDSLIERRDAVGWTSRDRATYSGLARREVELLQRRSRPLVA